MLMMYSLCDYTTNAFHGDLKLYINTNYSMDATSKKVTDEDDDDEEDDDE